MQTKRSYFFAGALGEGAENVKQTKNTWHTAQKKIKTRLFLYSFSEIIAAIFSFPPKYKLFNCTFSKRRTKTVWSFFLRNYLCRVPGKISLIIVFPQVTLYLAAL